MAYSARKLNIQVKDITHFDIVRRSIDARSRNVKVNLGVRVFVGELPVTDESDLFEYPDVKNKPEIIIVGTGPAGLFAGLRFIEMGLKPVLIERGKDVSARKVDIAAIHRNEGVDPDSNYGFGEGGAGTFSDGKLYTRSKKRGDVTRILQIFHKHGAQPDILIDAHPHIGTNVLPKVIKNMRQTILDAGGEIYFQDRVSAFIVENGEMKGVQTQRGNTYNGKAVVLATGHSARDVYYLLNDAGIHLEAKNFAMGVRVEHPQALIDQIQYHRPERGKFLPAATYRFVQQVQNHGVYSFCMCPGGVIVPASTAQEEMVVNGMSPSHRGGKFANSGIVTEIHINELKHYDKWGVMAGLKFQEEIEKKSFEMAGRSYMAPAQRLDDFVKGKPSGSLPVTSYHPGLTQSELHRWLPDFVSVRLREGFEHFNRKARGFLTNEAIVVGVESRTSSPVRIPRNQDTFEHLSMPGLFPCGEGAGYAGGIVSSAIDGESCAEKVAAKLGLYVA
ncbi:MAG: FAD-dependent oxidoreductase [Prolixibacteraceae bacterium]|nr:FAD-dependent oxidoreductase [Prolixibacteraceae bacterium]